MLSETNFHASFEAFDSNTQDKILDKVFSQDDQSRSCNVPSCTWTGKERREAFLHFCSKHLKGFSPYACICGQRFAHPPSARRHVKNKLKAEKIIGDFGKQVEGIPKEAFKLDPGHEKVEFATAVDKWLTSDVPVGDKIEPNSEESFNSCSNDIMNGGIENPLGDTPANMPFGETGTEVEVLSSQNNIIFNSQYEGSPSEQLLSAATTNYHKGFAVGCPDVNDLIPVETWSLLLENAFNSLMKDQCEGLPSDLMLTIGTSNHHQGFSSSAEYLTEPEDFYGEMEGSQLVVTP